MGVWVYGGKIDVRKDLEGARGRVGEREKI
jgi:hypothetical protein